MIGAGELRTFTLGGQCRRGAGLGRPGRWRGTKLMSAVARETAGRNAPLTLRTGFRPRLTFLRRIDFQFGGLAGHLRKRVFTGQRALRMRAGRRVRRRAANRTKPTLGLGMDGNGLTFAHGTSFQAAEAIGRASKFNRSAPGARPRGGARSQAIRRNKNRSRYTNRLRSMAGRPGLRGSISRRSVPLRSMKKGRPAVCPHRREKRGRLARATGFAKHAGLGSTKSSSLGRSTRSRAATAVYCWDLFQFPRQHEHLLAKRGPFGGRRKYGGAGGMQFCAYDFQFFGNLAAFFSLGFVHRDTPEASESKLFQSSRIN